MQVSPAYEVRGRRLLRCLLAPLSDVFTFGFCLAAGFFLLAGGWITAAAASFLAILVLRSCFLGLRADSDGLVVTNRFVRHHIPWHDVRGIWSPGRSSYVLFPTVRIERRHSVWFSISAYATLGMSREQRHAVTVDLAELGQQNGYLEAERSEQPGR
jgi:hypothetical protein